MVHKVSSLYPSIIIANNIGQNPLVGKVVLKAEDWKHINQDPTNVYFDPAKDLFDDLSTKNYSQVGNKWFNLPKFEDVIKAVEAEYEKTVD